MSPAFSVDNSIQFFELKHIELKNDVDLSNWEALVILVDSLHEP